MKPAPAVSAYAALRAAFEPHGLMPCGGFAFGEGEAAPPGPSGRPAAALVLVGHAGSSFWPHFASWRAAQGGETSDPLDRWSKSVIGTVARQLGLRAVYPSDRPWLPFQEWGKRAEGLKQSPLGLLIHPRFGLWQAFRGAVLYDQVPDDLPDPANAPHPCDACADHPCLSACPVGAFDGRRFDVVSCRTHMTAPQGARCLSGGCLARLSCPVGHGYAYRPEQQAFHMAAFTSAVAD